MNSIHISSDTITPIKTDYTLDTHFTIPSSHYKSVEGLEMHLNNLHFYEEDHKVNNFSNVMMTSRRTLDDFSEIELSTNDPFPQTFSTFLIFGFAQWAAQYYPGQIPIGDDAQYARYLTIEELADETRLDRSYALSGAGETQYEELFENNKALLPNNVLFEVELLNDSHCRITHTDTFVRTYLTYPDLTDRTCHLTFTSDNGIPTDNILSTQVFGYYYSRDQGRMVLYKNLSAAEIGDKHMSTYIILDEGEGVLRGTNTAELAEDFREGGWSNKSIISCRTFPKPDQTITIDNNWVRYAPEIEHRTKILKEANEKAIEVIIHEGNTLELDMLRYSPSDRLLSYEERKALATSGSSSSVPGLLDCKTCVAASKMTKLSKCYENLNTNFLVHSEYSTLSGLSALTMGVNFTPVKNFLNPDGEQSLGNPLEVFDDCDMRDYFKVFTGTNQIKGDSDITLGYQGYNTSITLKKDAVTYFHMPEDMAPYEWVNINWRRAEGYPSSRPNPHFRDYVGLLESGAIAGATPATSDKIWKRRADYRDNSAWGNSNDEMGNWMCTFLKESSNPVPAEGKTTNGRTGYTEDVDVGPRWVDRYYNTSKLTYAEALTSKTPSCYDTYADAIQGIEKYGFGDVVSQMRLEPGVLYAYHHLGEKENRKIVDSLHGSLVHKDFVSYVSVSGDLETQIQPEASVDGTNTYSFTGSNYARTVTPNEYFGNFCINFWMYQDDWSKPIGHEIIGNYLNNGIGIFNDECVTPFMYIPDTDGIKVTNTDLLTLNTVISTEYSNSQADNTFIVTSAPLDDYIVFKSGATGEENTVSRFDAKGLLTESKKLSAEDPQSVLQTNKILDTSSNNTMIFTLHEGTTAVSQIRRSDLFLDEMRNTTIGGLVQNVYLSPTGNQGTLLEVDKNGTPFIIDGIDSDINVYNTIHYINGNVLYRYDHATLSGTDYDGVGIPVLSGGPVAYRRNGQPVYDGRTKIEQVKSDLYGNTWVLHGDCISKFNRDNLLVKKVSLDVAVEEFLTVGSTTLTGEKCFDFVAEYTDEGFKHYAVVLNKNTLPAVSGIDVIKFDALKDTPECIGYNNVDMTINKPLYDIMKFTDFGSIKNSFNIQSPEIHLKTKPSGKLKEVMSSPVTAVYDSSFDLTRNALTFKIKMKNNFDADDVRWVRKKIDIANLSSGWHNFSISFDSWKNRLKMFIDGMIINPMTDALTDSGDWGKYSFTDTINSVMTVGASPFFNSGVLSQYLQQPNYYFLTNVKIKDFRLYNTVLAATHHKALSRVHADIHDMEWTIPSGSRQYLDIVDKMHKHRLPGRKSEMYDVSIINADVTDTTLQNTLTSTIVDTLTGTTPAHTVLRSFKWSADGLELKECNTPSDRYDANY